MGVSLLTLTGPGDDDGWQINLRWFRLFVLMHMASRSFLTIPALPWGSHVDPWVQFLRFTIIGTAIAGFVPGLAIWMTRLATLLLIAEVAITIPTTANHVFAEFLLLAFLSLLDERDDQEGVLLLQALRWVIAVLFFYTGLQKLLYGYYFRGEFLAYMAGTEDRFAAFLQTIIPEKELERLREYNGVLIRPGVRQPRVGTGPYRVESTLFIVMSNVVYIFEMVAGVLMILPRTRAIAAGAAIVFVVMIEVGARELTFGLLMINMLLLFMPGTLNKRLFPIWAACYAYLVLASDNIGLLPIFEYSPA